MTDPYEPLTLETGDGARLSARHYPSEYASAVVLVAGATGVPQGYYRPWITDLASHGFEGITFDYRGMASSRTVHPREEGATLQDWGRDLDAALDFGAQIAHGRPLLLVGHSVGGQCLGLTARGELLAGALTLGSQFGFWGHWPLPQRYGYAALWHLAVPAAVAAFGYLPGWLGTDLDLPPGVAAEWARWCRSPGYLLDFVPEASERFARVRAPVHVVGFADDPYAPPAAVRAYAAALPRAQVEIWSPEAHKLRQIGHFGFFRPSCRPLWALARERLQGLCDGALSATEQAPGRALRPAEAACRRR